MVQATVLVTGATGKTGRPVVEALVGAGFPVRALARRLDGRSEALRELGAEVVVGEMGDADDMIRAMTGVQRAYFCPPMDPGMLQMAAVFVVAAREARVESVVHLTQWLANPAHPSWMTRHSWLVDRMMEAIPGVAHTAVAPGLFADNYLQALGFAAHLGMFPVPTRGESRNAPPSNEDIGRVAAGALMDPARHDGRVYRPTGLVVISVREMAGIVGRVVGRRVRHVRMPMWMFVRAAKMQGFGPGTLSGFGDYVRDEDDGAFAQAPTGDVLAVTGREAEDFETIARRYAAAPGMQRTLANGLRQFGKFMMVPMTPGFELRGYDRGLHLPAPGTPLRAMESARWRRERGVAGGQASGGSASGGSAETAFGALAEGRA